jgi:hypothetical protein
MNGVAYRQLKQLFLLSARTISIINPYCFMFYVPVNKNTERALSSLQKINYSHAGRQA